MPRWPIFIDNVELEIVPSVIPALFLISKRMIIVSSHSATTMTSDKVLGIDLGTTNSGMAIVEGGSPQMLQNHAGKRLTPSVVHYDGDGEPLIGRRAIDREPAEPEQVVREIKRHMGEDSYTKKIEGKEFTPPEISAEILQKLKTDAEAYLDEDVTEVVVTVPAYFTVDQTAATKEAAESAGFEETHLLNEPTAAALAYGNGKDLDETLLVYDFGGGTLDISVIEVQDDEYKVLATDGDNRLGGADLDRELIELLAERYEQEHGVDILEDDEVRANLRTEAEETKIDLSTDEEAEALAPFLGQIDGEIISIEESVSRDTFESAIDELLDRAVEPVEQALEKADLTTASVDTVLLVGGSTQVPAVQERLKEFLGIEPTMTLDPDKIVAQGAAVYAQREIRPGYRCSVCGAEFEALLTLNEHYDGGHGGKNPEGFECTHCNEVFDTEDERQDHQAQEHSGSGDEGGEESGDGGGKGGSITGSTGGITRSVSQSLGTELKDGSMAVLIEHGTSVADATETDLFTTVRDNQTRVRVGVYEGDSDVAEENREIGEVALKGIEPRPAGVPEIEVGFNLDADGILHVEAEEIDSGEEVETDFEI